MLDNIQQWNWSIKRFNYMMDWQNMWLICIWKSWNSCRIVIISSMAMNQKAWCSTRSCLLMCLLGQYFCSFVEHLLDSASWFVRNFHSGDNDMTSILWYYGSMSMVIGCTNSMSKICSTHMFWSEWNFIVVFRISVNRKKSATVVGPQTLLCNNANEFYGAKTNQRRAPTIRLGGLQYSDISNSRANTWKKFWDWFIFYKL